MLFTVNIDFDFHLSQPIVTNTAGAGAYSFQNGRMLMGAGR